MDNNSLFYFLFDECEIFYVIVNEYHVKFIANTLTDNLYMYYLNMWNAIS